jgi:hypothetical protein
MTMSHVKPDQAKSALKPLRSVLVARQRPAHALRRNVSDRTFIHKLMRLMQDVDEVLINIRQWLAGHPRNLGWKEPWPEAKDYPI